MSHIFGPVPSRRLGRSLGVDLVPFKTCPFDCIYCQLGRTTNKTIERREWVPLHDILEELRDKLATKPDIITLSGSGEPTLYARLDELIEGIRSMTDIPIAVLTNGALLCRPELRRQLRAAHLVIPSLDAGDPVLFRAINRPHADIAFEQMLDGLIDFRREFPGEYWLEVFFLGGHNAIEADARKISACVRRIGPDRVQLNTVTRPTAEDYAYPVERARLEKIATWFEPPAEVIADDRDIHASIPFRTGAESVLAMIRRRPCCVEDIAQGLALHCNEALKYVEVLVDQGQVESRYVNGRAYYRGRR